MSATDKIRELNDGFRKTFSGGRVVVTREIAACYDVEAILYRVKSFDAFGPNNDPHGEHDFGSFEHGPHTIFWKIDYYDADLNQGSEKPSDPAVTTRVLTIMLAGEY